MIFLDSGCHWLRIGRTNPNLVTCCLNFDQDIIKRGFQDGVYAANKFVIDYLPTCGKIKKFKSKTLKKSYSSDSLILFDDKSGFI